MRRLLALGMFLMTACSGGEPGPDTEAAGETSSASGLTITHITKGSGARPTATDVVRVHYHGTFPNGKVFDSSVERGKPASFPLNRVIPCWTEGLQQMQVGGKAKLVCPPSIAYGARGAPPRIPPNATLYFEVELLAIQ
jgi:FKBP-type peptidyl-prolyl cis-trans isomerase FkpA